MENAFKNLLYAGIGLASEAASKVESEVNKLVEKGKVSDSEGKKIVDDFITKTEEKKGEFDKKFNELLQKYGYTKNSEVVALKKRIEELEKKMKK